MGFWEKAAKIGSAVGKSMIEQAKSDNERRQREMARAENNASRIYEDSDLVERFKNSSGVERYGYAAELERRGYLTRDSDGKFQRTSKTL